MTGPIGQREQNQRIVFKKNLRITSVNLRKNRIGGRRIYDFLIRVSISSPFGDTNILYGSRVSWDNPNGEILKNTRRSFIYKLRFLMSLAGTESVGDIS